MVRVEMSSRIRQASDDLFTAWNAHDPDAVTALYAEDVQIFDITSGISTRGRDEVHAHAVDRLTGFPDYSLERLTLLIDGGGSADRWIKRGTHTGEYQGLSATGRAMVVPGATFTDYDGAGLIGREIQYIDVPALLRQLGV